MNQIFKIVLVSIFLSQTGFAAQSLIATAPAGYGLNSSEQASNPGNQKTFFGDLIGFYVPLGLTEDHVYLGGNIGYIFERSEYSSGTITNFNNRQLNTSASFRFYPVRSMGGDGFFLRTDLGLAVNQTQYEFAYAGAAGASIGQSLKETSRPGFHSVLGMGYGFGVTKEVALQLQFYYLRNTAALRRLNTDVKNEIVGLTLGLAFM